jgi:hypothetical protein
MKIRYVSLATWLIASMVTITAAASTPAEDNCTVANSIGGICAEGIADDSPGKSIRESTAPPSARTVATPRAGEHTVRSPQGNRSEPYKTHNGCGRGTATYMPAPRLMTRTSTPHRDGLRRPSRGNHFRPVTARSLVTPDHGGAVLGGSRARQHHRDFSSSRATISAFRPT